MAKRSVILGKVMRAPEYDDFRPPAVAGNDIGLPSTPTFKNTLFLEKDINGERDRAKALLVRLGVDGDVPLAQARINAGLPPIWAANDNDKQRAVAA